MLFFPNTTRPPARTAQSVSHTNLLPPPQSSPIPTRFSLPSQSFYYLVHPPHPRLSRHRVSPSRASRLYRSWIFLCRFFSCLSILTRARLSPFLHCYFADNTTPRRCHLALDNPSGSATLRETSSTPSLSLPNAVADCLLLCPRRNALHPRIRLTLYPGLNA